MAFGMTFPIAAGTRHAMFWADEGGLDHDATRADTMYRVAFTVVAPLYQSSGRRLFMC